MNDFQKLYDALSELVGEEGEYKGFENPRIRVLAICYDLRHAIMGDREFELVDNGMEEFKLRRAGFKAPDKNVYLSFNVLWPEMLFDMIAINDMILLYSEKTSSEKYHFMNDKNLIWNGNISLARTFQYEVSECLRKTLSQQAYTRTRNLLISVRSKMLRDYIRQYLDVLNIKFIAMDKQTRLKNIPLMAKRLVEKNNEYCAIKRSVMQAAEDNGRHHGDFELRGVEYQEDILW